MQYVYVTSARRNPDSNPKEYLVDELTKYYNIDRSYRSYTIFISFTENLDKNKAQSRSHPQGQSKIGINPINEYETPLGIYAYPLRLVYNEDEGYEVPFGASRPYIQVLRLNTKRMLSTTTYKKYETDREKLKKIYDTADITFTQRLDAIKYLKKYIPNSAFLVTLARSKRPVFEDIENLAYELRTSSARRNKKRNSGGQLQLLWGLTQVLSVLLAIKAENNTTKWNWLFRSLGYDGIIDKGYGFIHPNEKVQALFFSRKAFIHEATLDNKYRMIPSKEHQKLSEHVHKFQNISSVKEYEKLCQVNPDIRYLKGYSLEVFEKHGRLVIADGVMHTVKNKVFHNFDIRIGSKGNSFANCNFYEGNFSNTVFDNCTISLFQRSFLRVCAISLSELRNCVIESGKVVTSTITNCEIQGGIFGEDSQLAEKFKSPDPVRKTVIVDSTISPVGDINFYGVLFKNCQFEGVDTSNTEIFVNCKFE